MSHRLVHIKRGGGGPTFIQGGPSQHQGGSIPCLSEEISDGIRFEERKLRLNPERDDDVIMVDLEEDKLKKHIVEEAKISRNSGF